MAKVITDIYGFAQEIQRQFGCDREVIEALCDRFSENVVIAADKESAAEAIIWVARDYMERQHPNQEWSGWGDSDSVLEDPDIDFDLILNKYRDTDQEEVGYTYYALKKAVLNIYTEEQCEEFVQRSV